ncbi:hypothetical protein [Nocardioides panacihumi]
MTSLTRGPLQAGVYWRRRLAVLGVVLLLVIGISRMFGGGGEDPNAKATNVSARTTPTPSVTPSPTATTSSPSVAATPTTTPAPAPTPTVSAAPTLPAPTGRCSDDDVVVAPSVTDAQATRTVILRLTLRTMVTTACTWRTSSHSIQMKITSGSDRIWSTIDCPRAIPTQDVVVRRDSDAVVNVAWNSRRSDETCSSHTQWAVPGYYHVAVAALGGEPRDIQFALTKPRPLPKPTPTPTPAASPTATAAAGARQEPQSNPQTKVKKKHRRVD